MPSDLKRFKEITKDNVVIMGRKTLESLPNGEPLKDRYNIVLTRDENFRKKDALVMHSIEHLLAYTWLLQVVNGLDCFAIGGGEVYKQLLPEMNEIYVTKINHKFDKVDTYFPNLDKSDEWRIAEESETYNEGGLEYKFITYKRVGGEVLSRELQDLIEKDELIRDAMKLQEYRCEDKTLRLIDEVRNELVNKTDDMTEITTIYKFAEILKERIK